MPPGLLGWDFNKKAIMSILVWGDMAINMVRIGVNAKNRKMYVSLQKWKRKKGIY